MRAAYTACMHDDYDTPWKQAITDHFAEFMAFYFPLAHAAIDWSYPPDFLDQELAALSPGAALGGRLLDKLVRVRLRDGGEHWMLLHVEVQGWQDREFAERIFIYHYRVYDHYRRPLASLAVLADKGARWRPSSYGYEALGCEMRLNFPVVKLQDYAARIRELLAHANPFALVTAAHLLTQRTRHNAHQRRIAKWHLTKLLYARQRGKQRMINLFKVIDWMMRLPDGLQARYMRGAIALQRRTNMTYLTSLERHAIGKGIRHGRRKGLQEGRQEGRAELLAALLDKRFGTIDPALRARLATADPLQLSAWALNFVDAGTLDEVFRD